jgi:chromate transporter
MTQRGPGSDLRTWAYVGLNSFGGPAGQIAVLHRVVVEERRWLDDRRFLHALNFCMLLPGPEAMQLATYLGWVRRGLRSSVVAGAMFVLPGALVMLGLAVAYVTVGDLRSVEGVLFGVQAAVVAIIAQAVVRIGSRALRGPTSVVICVASFLALFVAGLPFAVVVLAALAVGALLTRSGGLLPVQVAQDEDDDTVAPAAARRARLTALAVFVVWVVPIVGLVLLLGRGNVFTQEALVFGQAALLAFGGAYAVLGLVTQQAVSTYGWIGTDTMVTGLGLAETTPGPLILVCQFVGFVGAYQNAPDGMPALVAGLLGTVLTLWVLFLPSFFLVLAGAPSVEGLRHNRPVAGALAAVSAAVVGVIAELGVWFALNVVFGEVDDSREHGLRLVRPVWSTLDVWALALVVLGAVLVFGLRWSILRVIGVCAACGLLLALSGWHGA